MDEPIAWTSFLRIASWGALGLIGTWVTGTPLALVAVVVPAVLTEMLAARYPR